MKNIILKEFDMKYKIIILYGDKFIKEFGFDFDTEEEVLQKQKELHKQFNAFDSYIEIDYTTILENKRKANEKILNQRNKHES